MSASGVSAPLCTWLLAACYSRTMASFSGLDPPTSTSGIKLSSARRSGRRYRSRVAALQQQLGSVAALYESGISRLSSSFEVCPEFRRNAAKWLWDDDYTQQPMRRTSTKASATSSASTGESDKGTKRRVVVTGMGLVSSLGDDPDTFYQNLLEGKSGISHIEGFDYLDFPTRIAGEIKKFSSDGWVASKLLRRMDKFMLYLLTAGKKAIADAGMNAQVLLDLDKSKCGIIVGSALGGIQLFSNTIEALRVSYRKMNPFCVPSTIINSPGATLAMDLGWMGPNYPITTACATSNSCILQAANHIIHGEADVMLAGGSDAAINPIGLAGFIACRALSQRNDEPSKASRPWDRDRDGLVLGEGAGALVLEELEHAKKRGAEIYAEFLGGSSTFDAHHVTAAHPDGTGMLLCIENALEQAGVRSQDVNYVNAHAPSTRSGDVQEYKAIMQSLGQNSQLKVNSTKSMTGHLLGAAGAVDAIATIQAIRTGWLHPNINIDNPEQGVDMDVIVGGEKENFQINVALSNSFGFGGHNSSILFAPYDKVGDRSVDD